MKLRLVFNDGSRWLTLTAWQKGDNYFCRVYLTGYVILLHAKISRQGGLTK